MADAEAYDITVEIHERPWSYLSPQRADVTVRFADGQRHTLQAIGPDPAKGVPALVNHGGSSGRSTDDARAYAAAIIRAADVAETLAGPTGIPVTPAAHDGAP